MADGVQRQMAIWRRAHKVTCQHCGQRTISLAKMADSVPCHMLTWGTSHKGTFQHGEQGTTWRTSFKEILQHGGQRTILHVNMACNETCQHGGYRTKSHANMADRVQRNMTTWWTAYHVTCQHADMVNIELYHMAK